jgi:hypothetical protein
MRWKRCVVACAILWIAAVAHSQTTSGRIIGTVFDDQGGILPGVTVTIESEALLGGPQTEVTGGDGRFSFLGLAPGNYSVRAVLDGFLTQQRTDVKVNLGGAASLNIEMPSGTFTDEIQVVAETPVVDPTQVNTEQVFDSSYLKGAAIGSTNRSFQNILFQAAGVAGQTDAGGNPSVFGSTRYENVWYIDGADSSDPALGSFGTNFNFDNIQEIQFQTGGFEAEYGRATGGVINLVTKTGGNQFSGSLDLRYRDDSFQESGTHFDASDLDTERTTAALTLGGPILRDRMWFFASYQYSESLFTPIGGRSTDTREADLGMAKVSWQVDPAWRLMGRWSNDPLKCENCGTTRFVLPEAESYAEQGGDIFALEMNSVLTDYLLWNVQLSYQTNFLDQYPQSGDLATIGHINDDTGEFYDNFINQQYRDSDRTEVKTNLSWFVDDFGGSHEFKAGYEWNDTTFDSANCYTGTPDGGICSNATDGRYFEDVGSSESPIPLVMWVDREMKRTKDTGLLQTLYVQDAWRPVPNLTVKLGVRYDVQDYENDAGETVVDGMDMVQPRLGLAWDVGGDARNVVRASWGRFMHPSALVLPDYTDPGYIEAWLSCSSFVAPDPEFCAFVADSLGFEWDLDPVGFDPAGWLLLPANVFGAEGAFVDPGISPAFADSLIVAYERSLWERTSIELTYVNKETDDLLEDTCSQNFPVPTEELNVECTAYTLGNIPAGTREYEGFVVRLESRYLDWLTLLASYTYSTSEGSIEASQTHNPDFDQYPFHYENRFGYLSDDARHRVKLNGFFLLPYDFTIGFDAFYRSDFRWEPRADTGDADLVPEVADMIYDEYFVEPRGSRTAGRDRWNMDLQVSKGFTAGPVRLELIGSVYNLFSYEYVTEVCNDIGGCGSAGDLGDPIDWATPRRYEVGFRVEF